MLTEFTTCFLCQFHSVLDVQLYVCVCVLECVTACSKGSATIELYIHIVLILFHSSAQFPLVAT